MAQSTGLRLVANTDPIEFVFGVSDAVNIAIHYFTAANAFVTGGSIVLTVANLVTLPDLGQLACAPTVPALTILGGEYRTLGLGAGAGAVRITPSAITPPATGTKYVVSCSKGGNA